MTTAFVDGVFDALDERTLDILHRRSVIPVDRRRGWLVRRTLVCADIFGLVVAYFVAEAVATWRLGYDSGLGRLEELGLFLGFLPLWVLAARPYRLYDRDEERTDHSTADDLSRVFHLVTVWTFLLYALSQASHWINPPFLKIFVFWAMAIPTVTVLRSAARAYCRRQVSYLQNTIIVGAGDVGQSIARKLLAHREYGLNLVGFVDANPRERAPGLGHLTVLGDIDDLPELIQLLDIERVVFAFSSDHIADVLSLIRRLNELNVQVDVVPRFFDVLSPAIDIHNVEGIPVLGLRPAHLSRSDRIAKRTLDIVGALAGLLILAPVLAAIAVAVRLDSPGPIFFRQVRVGSGGCLFRIWKFRTMAPDADSRKHEVEHLNKHNGTDPRMFKIDDDPRVTRVGGWLRRHSLDELPQLFNVLRGEMSLVGPRPLIPEEHRWVDDWATRRVELKPGITGLWQVLGRDAIEFGDMVKLDYRYLTSWSVAQDVRLMLRTLPYVFGRRAA
ncbi:MAG TPA: sugar transferase [Gaiellaceae bacterium]|jgi:exopolysaccharide biosynthesis polyprenyl glycosylphosphotransferase|nr:sugar transferase [Gaiellaceae bacterium]